jgi:transposase
VLKPGYILEFYDLWIIKLQNLSDKELIQIFLQKFSNLEKEIEELKNEVRSLKDKLSRYENPKNSNNSSVSPSQDPNRATKSLRKKSDKKVGAQKGHKGSKLLKSGDPDKIILHDITECECCKSELPKEGEIKSRQLLDIPKIKIEVTEHQIITKVCENCGKKNKTNFPEELVQEAQYGNNIKAFSVYLQNYHMLPFKRCSELIEDLTGHKISPGSLANFQSKGYSNLEDYESSVKKILLKSSVLHADETGVRLNGKLHWMHVLSNDVLSYFGYHQKRGKQAIDAFNIIPLYNGNLVHDRFASYFSYECKHSLCNAHILRELQYLWETKELKWVRNLSNLLVGIHHQIKQGKIYSTKEYERTVTKFEKLITPTIQNYNKVYSKTKEEKLAFALEKYKHLFLKFIKEKEVPFDNNQAERDLRMIKVKLKISGCFRDPNYADYFARIRGYITTLKKNNQDVLLNIQKSFEGNPFLPIMGE